MCESPTTTTTENNYRNRLEWGRERQRNEERKKEIEKNIPNLREVVWLNSITCRSLDRLPSLSPILHFFLSYSLSLHFCFFYWTIELHQQWSFFLSFQFQLAFILVWEVSLYCYYLLYYIFMAFNILCFKIIFPIRYEWVSVAIVRKCFEVWYCSHLTAIYSDLAKRPATFSFGKLILWISFYLTKPS